MCDGKCECDLKTKLVGDGCMWCNPELAEYYEVEDDSEEA